MSSADSLRSALDDSVRGSGGGLTAANELCAACVQVLHVDGAAISFMHEGATRGTYGSSGELSRRLDELQFTFGEGPCFDAVRERKPVLVGDLAAPAERRWPAFSGAVLDAGVRAVFALPVSFANVPVGAIDLFCHEPGGLDSARLDAGLYAAELAAYPLIDLMTGHGDWGNREVGREPASLERVEIYQATGMIMTQLDVGAVHALVRLRAYAFANDLTASEVAWAVVERRLTMERDDAESDHGPGA